MDSIAEIVTHDITLYWHFNDQNMEEVESLQARLEALADAGQVREISFGMVQ